MKLTFPKGEHGDVKLRDGTLSIGRAPGNDIVLDGDDIADRHARVVKEALGPVISPVGNADVYINGRRVTDRTPVNVGDVLGVHRIQIRVQPTDASETRDAVPDEEAEAGPTRVRPAVRDYYLRGVSGDTFGRVFPLTMRTVVGRGEDCEIVLPVDEVSRRHASIEITPDGVQVTDLGSSNGTFVNGKRLRTADVGKLERNDEVAFDTIRFRVEYARGQAHEPSPVGKPVGKPAREIEDGGGSAGWWIAGIVVVLIIVALIWWFSGA